MPALQVSSIVCAIRTAAVLNGGDLRVTSHHFWSGVEMVRNGWRRALRLDPYF